MILELELPLLRNVEIAYVPKLKQLLAFIAESAPFTPNISKLGERIGINRQTLLSYLHYIEEAHLTRNLYRDTQGIGILQKPDKIFLENTNLMYLLKGSQCETGTVRETFLANQLGYEHDLELPGAGDFLVDRRFLIEVGGWNKNSAQLWDTPQGKQGKAFIAADDIEAGYGNKIPLWIFGFLY
jgi:predicted AAA+ superfamily ATPase